MRNLKKVLAGLLYLCLSATWSSAKDNKPEPAVYNKKIQSAPLLFIENRGQVADVNGHPRPDILFTAHGGGAQIYLTATSISYQFTHSVYPEGFQDAGLMQDPGKMAELQQQVETQTYRFSLTLAGANPHPGIRKERKNNYTENFYLPQCHNGITDVNTYEKVVYENVYPHIDWVVYSNGGGLKYDFIVNPGGDPSRIKLDIKDAKKVSITEAGELLMQTKLGEVREQAPVSYADGRTIPTRFKQNKDGTIGFAVGAVPPGAILTIDPTVSWATYFGGTATETDATAATFGGGKTSCVADAAGNIYLWGSTQSGAGIASGGYQTTAGGAWDAFLAKFDATGALVWSTYYGGGSSDGFLTCAVDASGNIFAGGYAGQLSTGLATPGAFQTAPSALSNDGLFVKFNPSGGRIWATYFGITSTVEFPLGSVTDPSGNVYFAGYITSAGFGTGGSVFQNTFGGSGLVPDGFMTKIDGATGYRIWFTYYGGTGSDFFRSCAIDASGNVYAVGNSATAGFASPGAYQTLLGGGTDALLVKFNGSTGSRLWATYYGGAGTDQAMGCATDGTSVYITGVTASASGIAPASGVIQSTIGGGNDAFIAKLDAATGTTRAWGTYYGGTAADQAYGCVLDATGNLLVVGTTASTSGIALGGFQNTYGGGTSNAMVLTVTPAGTLSWASYFGSTGAETGLGIATYGTNTYISGNTSSTTGIATPGSSQPGYGGGASDAFLAKIIPSVPLTITTGTIAGTPLCQGATISVPYTTTGVFTAGNVYTAQLSDASGSFTSPVSIGTLAAVTTGTITATIPVATPTATGYRIRVVSNTPVITGTDDGVNITINPLPNAGTITGTPTVCVAATTTLTDGAASGTWSSTLPAFGTVNTSGVVTGIAAGTTTISYTVINSCGTVAATVDVTVNPLPNAGIITGTPTVCVAATTTLTDGPAIGTWSSTLPAFGTVSTSGIVTGIAAGTTTISYTVNNSCGTVAATTVMSVNPLPDAGTISGTPTVCVAATTTLTDGAASGTWSSTLPAFGTVNTSGIITGVAAGATTISYTVNNSCGTAAATADITVNPMPNAGAITGTAAVCPGATTTLTDGAASGTWSSTLPAFGTVNASGVVTAIAAGTTTISYTVANSCGTVAATIIATINPSPDAGSISGITATCPGATTTLTDGSAGGTWSSALPAFGTINTSGIVTGVAAGTTTISYIVNNSCGIAAATTTVTINPLPDAGTITGTASLCMLATTTLSDGATGGAWSSVSSSIANVDPGGTVTGLSAGTSVISYTVTNSCGAVAASVVVTVNPLSDAGIITGVNMVCIAGSVPLTDAVTGGTWNSSDISIATVNASGAVAGIAVGTVTISYTVNSGCGIATATRSVTVNPLPAIISGPLSVCVGATISLSDTDPFGLWTSSNPNATAALVSGIITGNTGGTATITYTLPTSCMTTKLINVNTLPGPITGTATVCVGQSSTLSSLGIGTWSASNTNAAITSGGTMTGMSAGTVIISFALPTGCFTTRTETVNVLPSPITGSLSVCVGASSLLSDATSSGGWSGGGIHSTIVPATGLVTGISAGTGSVTYTLFATGCAAMAEITVNPLPSPIAVTGGGSYCSGGAGVHIGLLSSVTGINYQLYHGAIAEGSPVTGTGPGLDFGVFTTTGTYTVQASDASTSCVRNMTGSATVNITAIVSPSVTLTNSTGDTACAGEIATFTAIPTNGGSAPVYHWTLNGAPTGTTSALYIYAPFNGDIVGVKLVSNAACALPDSALTARTMTVLPYTMPSVSIAPGANPSCLGAPVTYHATAVNGGSEPFFRWTQNGINVATGPDYIIPPANGDTVYCIMRTNSACSLADSVVSTNGIRMTVITSTVPAVSISAHPGYIIGAGQSDTLKAVVTSGGVAPIYQWKVNGVNIPGATSATYISNTFVNGDSVTCVVTNSDACAYSAAATEHIFIATGIGVTANGLGDIVIAPNPNSGTFTIKGSFDLQNSNNEISVEIVNMLGQAVYRSNSTIQNDKINETVHLDNTLANGMYILHIRTANDHKLFHFVIGK